MKADELSTLISEKPLLTKADVSRILGVTPRSLSRYMQRPDFPKPRRVYGPRWTPEQIHRWSKRKP